ncbi:hypothetical protein RSOLAG1IB_02251 [Rhizoctonia solani AG-1 IB]|uniref:Uncharacterized protein n=1 Tax=Thanatephorus cucumeris (strain AG1-IB / isolate 7/3/14) TaxID=1108050 RepID=A0A0B7FIP6_THACB|nr:hypothetical protein RSOLAG1IB_02251 [Rhizoctonia solani AG-1 IB]
MYESSLDGLRMLYAPRGRGLTHTHLPWCICSGQVGYLNVLADSPQTTFELLIRTEPVAATDGPDKLVTMSMAAPPSRHRSISSSVPHRQASVSGRQAPVTPSADPRYPTTTVRVTSSDHLLPTDPHAATLYPAALGTIRDLIHSPVPTRRVRALILQVTQLEQQHNTQPD